MRIHFPMASFPTIFRVIVVLAMFFFAASDTLAQWQNVGQVNGVRVHRDARTGLEWTETLGKVPSSGWGGPANALVARYGFRLPSFRELQIMEAHGGSQRLRINSAMQQYYETSDPNTLAAAWGNGFRTPQRRKGVGMNWVIGVRMPVVEKKDIPVVQPTQTNPPAVKNTSVSASKNTKPSQAAKPVPKTDKPVAGGLPALPDYDD